MPPDIYVASGVQMPRSIHAQHMTHPSTALYLRLVHTGIVVLSPSFSWMDVVAVSIAI